MRCGDRGGDSSESRTHAHTRPRLSPPASCTELVVIRMAEDSTARQRFPYGRSNPLLEPATRAPEMDPLTELARLIGQTNPFGDQPAPARSNGHAWPGAPQAPGYVQPQAAD